MMIRAATLSLAQLFDSRLLRVLGISAALTLTLFLLLAVAAGFGLRFGLAQMSLAKLPNWLERGWGWIDGLIAALGGLGLFAGLLFLFPAIATLVMGLLLDDVVDAVEDRHYPAARAPRPTGRLEGLWLGLASGGRMLLVNLLLLPVYGLLLFTGIGPFLLYLLVNGYLLGRDFVQMIAIRHLGRAGEKAHRAKTRNTQFSIGVLTSLLYLVPIANILAPLLGAAMATHVFHQNRHV
jgi:CysZ protein